MPRRSKYSYREIDRRNCSPNGSIRFCAPCQSSNSTSESVVITSDEENCCGEDDIGLDEGIFSPSEVNWLQTEVEKRGHFFHFLPKFHCELNFIEMIWGYTKAALRKKCKYSFEDLKTNLPLQLESVPIAFIRRAARHCFRFLSGYRRGFHGPILDFIMKKYKSHRAIPLHVANADLEASFIAASKAK